MPAIYSSSRNQKGARIEAVIDGHILNASKRSFFLHFNSDLFDKTSIN